MLVKEDKITKNDGSVGYYEAIFDSSNVLKSTYFPDQNRLYISFNRGGVYSYENINDEKYDEFKNAESQGKFFIQEIKKKSDEHPYRKEFTLYPDEVKDLKEERDEKKEEIENEGNDNTLTIKNNDVEANNLVFYIENEEYIKVTPDGFYWKGNMVENDEEIYDKFKEWLNYVWSGMKTEPNNHKIIDWIKTEFEILNKKKENDELTQFEEGRLYELEILKQWI